MKNSIKKITAGIITVVVTLQYACAQQFQGFSTMAEKATREVNAAANYVANLVSVLMGVIGLIMLLWNYIKRSKGDGQSDDSLVKWGYGLIFGVLGIQVVKFVFFV